MLNLVKCSNAIKSYFAGVDIHVANVEYNDGALTMEVNVQPSKLEDLKFLFRIDILETGYCSYRIISGQVNKSEKLFEALNKFNSLSLLKACVDDKNYLQFSYDTYCTKIKYVILFMDMVLNDLVSEDIIPYVKNIASKTL